MLIKAVFGGIAAIVIGIIVISIPGESSEQASEEIIPQPASPIVLEPKVKQSSSQPITQNCSGTARCISGIVTEVIDGDTIRVHAQSIRFALSSTPELHEPGGIEAKNFVASICPVGSNVVVDEDDGQTQGSYGRILGVVYCNGYNLNESVLDSGYGSLSTSFCNYSEFASFDWADKYGCDFTEYPIAENIEASCDASYPTICIPEYSPDLDCGEIEFRNFKVLQPDPHRFDGDKDGIGCES